MKKILFALVIFSAVFMSCDSGMTSVVSVESVILEEVASTIYGSTVELEYIVIYTDGTESVPLLETFELVEGDNYLTKTVEDVESNASIIVATIPVSLNIVSSYPIEVYTTVIDVDYSVVFGNGFTSDVFSGTAEWDGTNFVVDNGLAVDTTTYTTTPGFLGEWTYSPFLTDSFYGYSLNADGSGTHTVSGDTTDITWSASDSDNLIITKNGNDTECIYNGVTLVYADDTITCTRP